MQCILPNIAQDPCYFKVPNPNVPLKSQLEFPFWSNNLITLAWLYLASLKWKILHLESFKFQLQFHNLSAKRDKGIASCVNFIFLRCHFILDAFCVIIYNMSICIYSGITVPNNVKFLIWEACTCWMICDAILSQRTENQDRI